MPESDWNNVECARWRDAISAIVDGEQPGVDGRLVDAHVTRCSGCRSFKKMIESSPGMVRIAPSIDGAGLPKPDLPAKISKLTAAADRARHWSVLRIVLAVVAVQVVAFALPALILGKENDVATHSARHLGAFGVAYGVALLVVVARPARARSILPVALVLACAQIIGAIVDLATGGTPLISEVRHLPADHQRLPDLVPGRSVDETRRRPRSSCSNHALKVVDVDRLVG